MLGWIRSRNGPGGMIQPFPLLELLIPTVAIFLVGWLVSFYMTRRLHWSLFVALIKALLFICYYGLVFDGTFTFLDDWSYLERGALLRDAGISLLNAPANLELLFDVAGSRHFIYYLFNADAFRIFGDGYYSPVALNVMLTFVAAGLMAAAARRGLSFSQSLTVGLFVFIALHPDILAWSTLINVKDTLVLVFTALAIFAVSLAEDRRYMLAVLLGLIVGSILLFTRFYVPLMLLAALFGAVLLSSVGRHRLLLWLLVPAGFMVLVSILGASRITDSYELLKTDFVNPFYGVLRIALTPIPFNATADYAFLNLPQVFHWLLLPMLIFGMYRVWRRDTLTARFVVIYFMLMLGLYGIFGELQGPRHRYQLDGLIGLFQFYGITGLLVQIMPRQIQEWQLIRSVDRVSRA